MEAFENGKPSTLSSKKPLLMLMAAVDHTPNFLPSKLPESSGDWDVMYEYMTLLVFRSRTTSSMII